MKLGDMVNLGYLCGPWRLGQGVAFAFFAGLFLGGASGAWAQSAASSSNDDVTEASTPLRSAIIGLSRSDTIAAYGYVLEARRPESSGGPAEHAFLDLIAEAVRRHPSVRSVVVRRDEAGEVVKLERAPLFPQVDIWTHPGKVEAPYTVCIASASNLTGLVKSSVECRRTGL